MLEELKDLEQEVCHSELREKERELLQLQAQINPHFLFNTLETIESYAIRNNGEAVGDMVQSVSRMMRYNVRNDGGRAPIKEEIAYIQHFLTIHRYRNGVDVHVDFNIDPAVLDKRIMKLSIQPFVENALKYGWTPSMKPEDFSLSVKVKVKESHLQIIIQDTGTGFPEDILSKINSLIETKGEFPDSYFRNHTGIWNVYRRYFLVYGDGFNWNITSLPNEGSIIHIQIPDIVSGAD